MSGIRRCVLIPLFLLYALAFAGSAGAVGRIGAIDPSDAMDMAGEASSFTLPVTITDDRGRSIHLDRAARRIISLSPNITELVFAAGAGGKLVGVSRYSDYPDTAKSIPDVGDSSSLDLERAVALQPDLVIAWRSGNDQSDIEKLEKLGLTVFATEAATLGDVPRLLRTVGKLAGTPMQAEQAAKTYEEELQKIRRSYSNRPKVSVFQLIWHQPLMTVNGNHIISDIIRLCGGINVFASASSLTPVISGENLLDVDPQAIISSVSFEHAETGQSEVKALLRRFSHISAVRNNNLFFVHPDLIHRQTVRVLQGARLVCEQLERVRSGRKTQQPA